MTETVTKEMLLDCIKDLQHRLEAVDARLDGMNSDLREINEQMIGFLQSSQLHLNSGRTNPDK